MNKLEQQKQLTTSDTEALKLEIDRLKKEIEHDRFIIHEFEAILRAHLSDEIIEVQELTVLYKHLKKAKKAQRILQKQKGKNYKAPVGLQKTKPTIRNENLSDTKELKRLYKESMLLVHPDKFAMVEEKEEQATALTQKLIEIYQEGDLTHLKAFHAHLQNGKALDTKNEYDLPSNHSSTTYLQLEIEKLTKELENIRAAHIYHLIQKNTKPMDYVHELKIYFDDKIAKLKKRTRKAR